MTSKDIQHIVTEAIKAKENNWTSWLKTIITLIFIPIISVYASTEVSKYKLEKLEKEAEKLEDSKVDKEIYDQYIIKQIELQKLYNERTERIEKGLKEKDEELKSEIEEIKEFLNKVYNDKKLWVRDFSNKNLYELEEV